MMASSMRSNLPTSSGREKSNAVVVTYGGSAVGEAPASTPAAGGEEEEAREEEEEEEEVVVGPAQGRRRGGAETEAARGEKAEQVRPAGASRGRRRSAAAGAMATRIMSWGALVSGGKGACGNGGLDWREDVCRPSSSPERAEGARSPLEAQSSPMSHGTGHGAGAQFLRPRPVKRIRKYASLYMYKMRAGRLCLQKFGGIQIMYVCIYELKS